MALQSIKENQIHIKLNSNPLVRDIISVSDHILHLKEGTRKWYYDVVLSGFSCPDCNGRLHMTGTSECSCNCGNVFDPTLAFQKSVCCQAKLLKKTYHYVCSKCHKSISSRFLFDEKIFDKAYFQEAMQEFRQKQKRKKEEMKRLLAESRSDNWKLKQIPKIEGISGLIEDLDDFIQWDHEPDESFSYHEQPRFNMNDYRGHIYTFLDWDSLLFSDIDPLGDDLRIDKIARFITLVFMDNEQEVDLTQQGDNILVQRVYNEAYT